MSGNAPPALSVSTNGFGAITDQQLNTFVQGGALVADARAFVGLSGMTLYLIGQVTPGDGGQGSFYWNSASTTPDDNGVTAIAPSGLLVGRWLRLPEFATGFRYGGKLTSNTTLTQGQSGTCFEIDSSLGAFTVTLPTPAAGLNYTFIGVAGVSDVSLAYTGTLQIPNSNIESSPYAANLQLTGAVLQVYSDGVNWLVTNQIGVIIFSSGYFDDLGVGGNLMVAGTASAADATTAHELMAFEQTFAAGATTTDKTVSRALGVNYTNTTGRPIFVTVTASSTMTANAQLTIGSVTVAGSGGDMGIALFACGIVGPGQVYSGSVNMGTGTLVQWTEC